MAGHTNRLCDGFMRGVGSLGLFAATLLAMSIAAAPDAQALSPIGATAASKAKGADPIIQIRDHRVLGGGRGGFRGGGFRGGAPLGSGGFRGGGFRHGGPAMIGSFRPAFRGAIHRGGGFRYAAPIYRPHYAPIRHYGYRRHYRPRYYGYAPYYYGYTSYYGYAPRYYAPRRVCRIVYTYYGPRRICRTKPWRHHLRRHHHHRKYHHVRRVYW